MSTFTVETGDGVIYANSYSTVEYADDYFSLRGITTWSGTTSEKEASLILGTDYIEDKYGTRFKGSQATVSGLSFPRNDAYYSNGTAFEGLPDKVVRATVEYALLNITDSLYSESVSAGVTSINRALGAASESTSYSSGGVSSSKVHPKADGLLVEFLNVPRSYRA